MKKYLPILGILAVLLLTAAPLSAADAMTCDHTGATIASLHHCVMHASEMGHIHQQRCGEQLAIQIGRGPGRL